MKLCDVNVLVYAHRKDAIAGHAALAIEYDCDWISTEGDFARFPGLRWRHPLAR